MAKIRQMASPHTILHIAANGRVVIPSDLREKLGVRGGGKMIARLVDGALVLEPRDVAIRRARRLVAKYVPKDTNLIGELIAERRAEAQRE
jgi:AbrB family looped-hinge helix DNA binding protein